MQVKINTERISEEDAARELKEGRDIFTAVKDTAKKLVSRVSKENYEILKVKSEINPKAHKIKDFKEITDKDNLEIHGNGAKGYYWHYHPRYRINQETHPHCWYRYGGGK